MNARTRVGRNAILPAHEPERRLPARRERIAGCQRAVLEAGAPFRFRGTIRERTFVNSLPSGEGRGEGNGRVELNCASDSLNNFQTGGLR